MRAIDRPKSVLDFLQRKLVGRREQRYAVLTIFGLANAGYYRLQGSYLGYPKMGSASIRPTPPASSPRPFAAEGSIASRRLIKAGYSVVIGGERRSS